MSDDAPPAKLGPLTRLARGLSDSWVMTQRNLLHLIRVPNLLVFATIQPVMFLVLFNFVIGGAIRLPPGLDSYINYLLPAIMIQSVMFGSLRTTVGLATDLQRGAVERFRALPMARAALLAGRTGADTVRNAFVVVLVTAVAVALGYRFQTGPVSAVGALVLVVAFGYCLSWIAAGVALTTRDPEAGEAASIVVIFPLIFASSAFVPTATMPDWLATFAAHQPVTQVIDGARYLSLDGLAGNGPAAVGRALAWIVGILAVAVPLAVRQYRRQ